MDLRGYFRHRKAEDEGGLAHGKNDNAAVAEKNHKDRMLLFGINEQRNAQKGIPQFSF